MTRIYWIEDGKSMPRSDYDYICEILGWDGMVYEDGSAYDFTKSLHEDAIVKGFVE